MIGGQWTVGDAKVTSIMEIPSMEGFEIAVPDANKDRVKGIDWLRPHFATEEGSLIAAIQALVIHIKERRILVDTCIGNDKPRSFEDWSMLQTSFLEDMDAAGYPVDSIDTVLCTHLHFDHVGWNTRLVNGKWVPTFQQARYLMGKQEFEFWSGEDDETGTVVFEDSVQPVFDAGLVDLVAMDHRICDEVSLFPTVGHTPGHVSVLIQSQGDTAVITGDLLHHPCQIAHPEWNSAFDSDPAQAHKTRKSLFEKYCGSQTLIIGTHFARPTAGHLVKDGKAFRLNVN